MYICLLQFARFVIIIMELTEQEKSRRKRLIQAFQSDNPSQSPTIKLYSVQQQASNMVNESNPQNNNPNTQEEKRTLLQILRIQKQKQQTFQKTLREGRKKANLDFKRKFSKKQRDQKSNSSKFGKKFQEAKQIQQFRELSRIKDPTKERQQIKIPINGIDVLFPFKPYKIQQKYMQSVIQCLNKKTNALLQSPTGTGKTLCLLCAILSWMSAQSQELSNKRTFKQLSRTPRRLIYLSRTHTQISQAIKQLKSTCFTPNMTHFSSRDYSCIKEQLRLVEGQAKVQACSNAVHMYINYQRGHYDKQIKLMRQNKQEIQLKQFYSKMCFKYKTRADFVALGTSVFNNKINTVQDMVDHGKRVGFCPYYYSASIKPYIDVLFMPYIYLLDTDLLTLNKQIIKDSIIVFDQAHNVAEAACDGRSYQLTFNNFVGAQAELHRINSLKSLYVIKTTLSKELAIISDDLKDLQSLFNQYLREIPFDFAPNIKEKLYMSQSNSIAIKIIPSNHTFQQLYQLFHGRNVNSNHSHQNIDNIRHLLQDKQGFCQIVDSLVDELRESEDGQYQNLQKISRFIKKTCIFLGQSLMQNKNWFSKEINHFRLSFQKTLGTKQYTIKLFCLVPWLTFSQIKNYAPHSLIFTSGTMSPLDSWEHELGISAPVRLANSHVITDDQISLNIVKNNANNRPMHFSFTALQNDPQGIYSDLALTIVEIAKKIPNGVIAVCPNFRTIQKLFYYLNRQKLKAVLNKTLIFEARGKKDYIDMFKKQSQNGALLICVCRGKSTEGIDFPDHHCRAVIIIGVPYPNIMDPTLIERKEHFSRIAHEAKTDNLIPPLSYGQWEFNSIIRSVNQALGRVIRHVNDYGMLFLLDERYAGKRFSGGMPKWAKNSVNIWSVWNQTNILRIQRFFNENNQRFSKLIVQKPVSYSQIKKQQNIQKEVFQQRDRSQSNSRTFEKQKTERPILKQNEQITFKKPKASLLDFLIKKK